MAELPLVIELGLADSETVGAGVGAEFTVTEALEAELPPAPLQVKV